MKKILLIVAVVVFIIALAGALVYNYMVSRVDADLQKLMAAEIQEIDLAKIANGTYSGSYQAFPIDVEVEVVVQDHKIIGIDLKKHTNGKGQAAEVLPQKVLEAQSLKVDMVSGATHSSKTILLAIQDALSKSQ